MIKSLETYYELNADQLVFDLNKEEREKLLIALLGDIRMTDAGIESLINILSRSYLSLAGLKELNNRLIEREDH